MKSVDNTLVEVQDGLGDLKMIIVNALRILILV